MPEPGIEPGLYWENIHASKAPAETSWFQQEATVSLGLISAAEPDRGAHIIDVGGGASTLVDGLLADEYAHLTVLDISATALSRAQQRLGARSGEVEWMQADVLTAPLPADRFDVWHDRAVFHFLTRAADRTRYVEQVRSAVRANGAVIIATFAEDGPERCSGLDVVRYSPETLSRELGAGFTLVKNRREQHVTPWSAVQNFTWCVLRHDPPCVD